jgi:hypothetical protein
LQLFFNVLYCKFDVFLIVIFDIWFLRRLYITQHYAAFSGWPETRVLILLRDIAEVNKTNTLYYVPNALSIIMKDRFEYFLGSFVDREACHSMLTNLSEVGRRIAETEGYDLAAEVRSLEFGYQVRNTYFDKDKSNSGGGGSNGNGNGSSTKDKDKDTPPPKVLPAATTAVGAVVDVGTAEAKSSSEVPATAPADVGVSDSAPPAVAASALITPVKAGATAGVAATSVETAATEVANGEKNKDQAVLEKQAPAVVVSGTPQNTPAKPAAVVVSGTPQNTPTPAKPAAVAVSKIGSNGGASGNETVPAAATTATTGGGVVVSPLMVPPPAPALMQALRPAAAPEIVLNQKDGVNHPMLFQNCSITCMQEKEIPVAAPKLFQQCWLHGKGYG